MVPAWGAGRRPAPGAAARGGERDPQGSAHRGGGVPRRGGRPGASDERPRGASPRTRGFRGGPGDSDNGVRPGALSDDCGQRASRPGERAGGAVEPRVG
ncbi:hypothetical protein C1Y63_02110 [Corynebacterium sp. 13CS0277]|nr:hypothetical protein C1Y63_02110 [Corynebacterium sp. 13CS0277]